MMCGNGRAGDGQTAEAATGDTELATFGSGCFWCTEAVLERIDGVISATSGYMGGTTKDPTYREVSSGTSGHAEVTQIEFDPAKVSYAKLLGLFWRMHDPTQLNRQGADVGTQYRSAIFYHSDKQQRLAEKSKQAMQATGKFRKPIVTEITPAVTFYPAEEYHQDYFRLNPKAVYCRAVIQPKIEKLGLD